MTPEIDRAFEIQIEACARMGSPFTAHLAGRLREVLDGGTRLGRTVGGWEPDPVASALVLRLCGAFHRVVRDGEAPAFAAHYPPGALGPDFDQALAETIRALDDRLTQLIASPPQTNEIGRSGVFLGGLMRVAAQTGHRLEILEIGASAGLNLHLDRFTYDLGGRIWAPETPPHPPIRVASDWRGTPPAEAPLRIASRAGCDRAPIDPGRAEDRARLMAYIWPDQPHRLARTEAALALAAREGPRVARADAADWVEACLADQQPGGRARVLMHSIMWQYLDAPPKARIRAAMAEAGARATPDRPLAWLHLERDGTVGSAALTLTLWPAGEPRLIARADYHGAWVDWRAEAERLSAPAPE